MSDAARSLPKHVLRGYDTQPAGGAAAGKAALINGFLGSLATLAVQGKITAGTWTAIKSHLMGELEVELANYALGEMVERHARILEAKLANPTQADDDALPSQPPPLTRTASESMRQIADLQRSKRNEMKEAFSVIDSGVASRVIMKAAAAVFKNRIVRSEVALSVSQSNKTIPQIVRIPTLFQMPWRKSLRCARLGKTSWPLQARGL